MTQQWLDISDLYFKYPQGDFSLSIPSLQLTESSVFIKGTNGKGKTTFVHLLTSAVSPLLGTLSLSLGRYSIIPQRFSLISHLTVLENLFYSLVFTQKSLKITDSEFVDNVAYYLGRFSLQDYMHQQISQLSVGQQQQVSIVKALLTKPDLIIADEPTSSLDQHAEQVALQLLFEDLKERSSKLLVISHNHYLQSQFDRIIDFDALKTEEPAHVHPVTV